MLALFQQLSTFFSMTSSTNTLQKKCKCTLSVALNTLHKLAETVEHLACKDGSPVTFQHRNYQRQMHSDTVRKQDRSHFPTFGRTTNHTLYTRRLHSNLTLRWNLLYEKQTSKALARLLTMFVRKRQEFYEAHRQKFPLVHLIYQHRVTRFLKSERTG